MMPVSKPHEIKRVKIRALKPSFYLGGHVAQVGEEGVVDYADVHALLKAAKVEVLGDAAPRTISAKDLKDPPPLRRTV
jgi:hypothetical protein